MTYFPLPVRAQVRFLLSKASTALKQTLASRTVSRSCFALSVFMLASLIGAIPAHAGITTFNFNVDSTGNPPEFGAYSSLIQNIRNAAGGQLVSGFSSQVTDIGNGVDQSASLIQINLTANDGQNSRTTLWLTTNNLYLRGFTNTQGQTFQFTDTQSPNGQPPYNLQLGLLRNGGNGANVFALGYSSAYNAMSGRAGVSRNNLNVSYNSFFNAFYSLAYANINANSGAFSPNVAQALLLMTQYVSEAARFNDIFGFLGVQMAGGGNRQSTVMPLWLVNLENDWSRLSNWGVQELVNPGQGAITLGGAARNSSGENLVLTNFGQAAALLAMFYNVGEVNAPQTGGINGDWNFAEI